MRAAPAAIWIAHDPQCLRVTGNPAASALLRVASGANVSPSAKNTERPHYEVFRAGQLVEVDEQPMQVAGRTGQPVVDQELECRFPDGTSTWIYGTAAPLMDENGVVCGVIATFVDITERKQAGRKDPRR